MRRPPIKIVVSWVAREIVKAGAYAEPLMVPVHRKPSLEPGLAGQDLLDAVHKIVQADRLALTDYQFRQNYAKYIRRAAPC
jgi:hypothetical protein